MIAAPDEEPSEEEEEDDDGTSDFTLGALDAILGLDGGKDCAFRKQDRERVGGSGRNLE